MSKKETLLSLIAAFLIPFPLMITAVSNVYHGLRNSHFAVWTILGAASLILGYIAGYTVKKSRVENLHIKRIITVSAGAVISAGSISAVFALNMSTVAMIFLPLAIFLWYMMGCKSGLGLDLLTNTVLGVICIEAAFLFPMCKSFDKSGTTADAVLAVFGAEIVICAVLLNIRHLRKITVRGNSVSVISKNTVRFNLKISLSFAFIVLAFFLFARFGAYWLWEGLKALIKFLLSLTREPECIDVQIINDIPKFTQLFSAGNSLTWLIIMLIIVIVGILLLIKPIRNAISELMEKFNKRLEGLGGKYTKKLAYTDFYETDSAGKQVPNGLKHAYRLFLKEKELRSKYRLGYKAFIIGLGELGETNLPCDTTLIHSMREEKNIGSEFGSSVIKRYEGLRYNDESVTEEDCIRMEIMLKRCAGVKRSRKVILHRKIDKKEKRGC